MLLSRAAQEVGQLAVGALQGFALGSVRTVAAFMLGDKRGGNTAQPGCSQQMMDVSEKLFSAGAAGGGVYLCWGHDGDSSDDLGPVGDLLFGADNIWQSFLVFRVLLPI